MPTIETTKRPLSPVGTLLQYWRGERHMSQLQLGLRADVSPRHVSFVETGRSRPSREMVLLLASALEVPLRERNSLLLAAGYAPVYRETSLEAPEMQGARAAIDAILRKHEPYPAVVMDRHWDIVTTNHSAERFFGKLLEGLHPHRPDNVLHLMFDPDAARPRVVDWPTVAEQLIRRVHREVVGSVNDEGTAELLRDLLSYPDVPPAFASPNLDTPLEPIVPVAFDVGGDVFEFFSTVTTLGTPQDITLQEIRIECFFPLNDATARLSEEMAGGGQD